MAYTTLTIKDGAGTSQTMGAFQDTAGNNYPTVTGDTNIQHYAAGKSQLTPVAAIKACFVMAGSATKTVRVKRIVLSGIATSAGEAKFAISKCSDAGTLGSAALTTLTATPLDSGFAAATALFSSVGTAVYTTEPAIVGTSIVVGELNLPATGTGVSGSFQEINFGKDGIPAVVLRGVAQVLIVDFLGATLQTGAKYSASIVWSEDAS